MREGDHTGIYVVLVTPARRLLGENPQASSGWGEVPPQGTPGGERGDPVVSLPGTGAEDLEARSRTSLAEKCEWRHNLLYRPPCTTIVAAQEHPKKGQGGGYYSLMAYMGFFVGFSRSDN